MRLLTPPWKTAWYDDHLSERFFQEISRAEGATARSLESSAQWMEQLMVEFGQLAQNMIQLENPAPTPAQIRMAFEKALKLSATAVLLTASLDRADPGSRHTPVIKTPALAPPRKPATPPETRRPAAPPVSLRPPAPGENGGHHPMRETILSLSRKGLSVTEIAMVTGQERPEIEKTLGRR